MAQSDSRTTQMAAVLQRHRGPFVLQVSRTTTRKPGVQVVALPGRTDREDVEGEALALLADPRDTIVAVHVWSDPEQQHVTTIRAEAQP